MAEDVLLSRRDRVRTALAGCDWTLSTTLLNRVSNSPKDRANFAVVISDMRASGELLRSGKPPKWCTYKLNPDFVPPEPTAARGPAEGGPAKAYVAHGARRNAPLAPTLRIEVPLAIKSSGNGIVFVRLCVDFHGLQFRTMAEVENLRALVLACVRSHHPAPRFDSDVEVELELTAGEPIR
jgi:hypothetical protein